MEDEWLEISLCTKAEAKGKAKVENVVEKSPGLVVRTEVEGTQNKMGSENTNTTEVPTPRSVATASSISSSWTAVDSWTRSEDKTANGNGGAGQEAGLDIKDTQRKLEEAREKSRELKAQLEAALKETRRIREERDEKYQEVRDLTIALANQRRVMSGRIRILELQAATRHAGGKNFPVKRMALVRKLRATRQQGGKGMLAPGAMKLTRGHRMDHARRGRSRMDARRHASARRV
ncbi:hypothetical protein AAMO2058_001508600 [Amorphochlora amoebiformis]